MSMQLVHIHGEDLHSGQLRLAYYLDIQKTRLFFLLSESVDSM